MFGRTLSPTPQAARPAGFFYHNDDKEKKGFAQGLSERLFSVDGKYEFHYMKSNYRIRH